MTRKTVFLVLQVTRTMEQSKLNLVFSCAAAVSIDARTNIRSVYRHFNHTRLSVLIMSTKDSFIYLLLLWIFYISIPCSRVPSLSVSVSLSFSSSLLILPFARMLAGCCVYECVLRVKIVVELLRRLCGCLKRVST